MLNAMKYRVLEVLGLELSHLLVIISMVSDFHKLFLFISFLQFVRGPSIVIFVEADFLPREVKKVIISDYSITSIPLSLMQCSTHPEFDLLEIVLNLRNKRKTSS